MCKLFGAVSSVIAIIVTVKIVNRAIDRIYPGRRDGN